MTKPTGINFMQMIKQIISGGESAEKCDTKNEYKDLAILLAGHQEELNPDESLYALGLMVDYEKNRVPKPPAAEPPATEPPVDEVPPKSLMEDINTRLFLDQMKARSLDDWLNHYLAPNFGFDINIWENPEESFAGNKRAVDDILDKKIVNKDDLKFALTQQPLSLIPYLVDGTIAERIDKALNMDKSDVYELVIVPLIKSLKSFNDPKLKIFIARCESKNPKNMSIKEMQDLINKMVDSIKIIHKDRVANIKNSAEFLANISHGIANDSKNVEISIESRDDNKIQYNIKYKNNIIVITKDVNGKYSLDFDKSYDQTVEDNSITWTPESVLADLIEMIEGKISIGEIKPEYIERIISTKDSNPPTKDSNPPTKATNLSQYERREDLAGKTVKQKDGTFYKYGSRGSVVNVYDANGNKTRLIIIFSDGTVEESERDANGNITREIFRYADGTVCSYKDYEYDANGNITREIFRYEDGTVCDYTDYEYDADGNKTREIERYADGTVDRYTEYDADGNKTREIYRYSDGTVDRYTEYDANGNGTREIERYADGTVRSYTDYDYDANGNKTRTIRRYSDGTVVESEYDANGELIRSIKKNPDGTIEE